MRVLTAAGVRAMRKLQKNSTACRYVNSLVPRQLRRRHGSNRAESSLGCKIEFAYGKSRKSSNSSTTNGASTLVRMECVLDKLKLLNYEEYYVKLRRNKPITRHHFAMRQTSNSTGVNNINLQFREYVTLVSWLLSVIYGTEDHPVQKFASAFYDYDPITCVETIVQTLKDLQQPSTDETEEMRKSQNTASVSSTIPTLLPSEYIDGHYFTITKLRQGYGDDVVLSLDLLTAKACDKLFLRFELPSRVQIPSSDNRTVYDQICIEDGNMNDLDKLTIAKGSVLDKRNVSVVETVINRKSIQSKIHPNQWRDEVDRVAPQLKGAMDSFRTTMASTDREWRSQLLQTNQHQEKMTSLLPWIDTYINCVTKTVAKDVDSMRTKTAYMVQHFGSLCEEFRKVRNDYKMIEKRYQQSSDTIKTMKEELERLDDLFACTTREMNEKGRSMSDMTPLLNLKAAMDNIKLEIKNSNVRIGVLNHTLLELSTQNLEHNY